MEQKLQEVLLDVRHLRTSFIMDHTEVKAVNDVFYIVHRGEIVAVVGESGSGKSVTQMTVNRLLQVPPGKILGGEVWFDGENLLEKSQKEMQKIRGSRISMIFQEPMTSLNPVISVGSHVVVVILAGMNEKSIEILSALLNYCCQTDDLGTCAHDDHQLDLTVIFPLSFTHNQFSILIISSLFLYYRTVFDISVIFYKSTCRY